MFESKNSELEWKTDGLAMNSKYLELQMKMIWKLPWWFYVEERILRKTKKSGVLALAHILGWEMKDRMAAETLMPSTEDMIPPIFVQCDLIIKWNLAKSGMGNLKFFESGYDAGQSRTLLKNQMRWRARAGYVAGQGDVVY